MSAYLVTETGVVIEYPTGRLVSWESSENYIASIWTDASKNVLVAKVPRGCVVGFRQPIALRQAPDARNKSLTDCLEIVTAAIENLPTNWENRQRLRKLKAKLSHFDARSGVWKR